MTKILTSKQKRFIENHIIRNMSISESVRRAGYQVKSGRVEDYGSLGCRILKTERVAAYKKKLQEKSFSKDLLSIAEKRSFLARAVRSDASNPDPDLVQEYAETTNEHGTSKRVKIVSKLEALNIDNKMAGDYYSDREPQATNPFLFIVGLSKGLPMQHAQQARALPDHAVIDAEVTALE